MKDSCAGVVGEGAEDLMPPGAQQTRYSRTPQRGLSHVPWLEGLLPAPSWSYKLASQVTLKWGIWSDKGLFPVAATEWDRVNLQTLRTIRMPAGQVQVPCPVQPPTPTKQPMYRDLQQTRVAKHTVGKLFLFRFLEAQDRPSRKLPL